MLPTKLWSSQYKEDSHNGEGKLLASDYILEEQLSAYEESEVFYWDLSLWSISLEIWDLKFDFQDQLL